MQARDRIFLVEDDEVDARTIQRAVRRQEMPCDILRARDGIEALQIIRHQPDSLINCLMLVDLNMPRMGGLELIRHMRDERLLEHIPVFILTTSRMKEDRDIARELRVSGYIVKDQIEIEFKNLFASYTLHPAGET